MNVTLFLERMIVMEIFTHILEVRSNTGYLGVINDNYPYIGRNMRITRLVGRKKGVGYIAPSLCDINKV